MQRPRRLANKVVEQWEQNLLLKVMQRKIKCAKSTISGLQGTKKSQSQALLVQKPKSCLEICKEEWNLLDAEQKQCFNETLKSQFGHPDKPEVNDVVKYREEGNELLTVNGHSDATTNQHQNEENITPQIGASQDGCEAELGFPVNMENFISLTERFHENFKDSEDDFLSQIWSSCRRDNSLFDVTTGLNQTRKAGALHNADFDSSPIPMSKMVSLKERRIPKANHPKKNVVKEPAMVSRFMKKRETGWRE